MLLVALGVVLLLAAGVLLVGCGAGPAESEEIVLGIDRRPGPLVFGRGTLSALPQHSPLSTDPFQVDLRSCDLSDLDLSDRLAELLAADFDSKTIWPGGLPSAYNPDLITELGRSPGLGLSELHERGITGRGVGAILDQPLVVDHVEYGERLRDYEERLVSPGTAQMHGPAVASIAVGKTVGVAPEADLYYIATDGPKVPGAAAGAIERFLAINRILPPENRIRVISISVGLSPSGRLDRLVAQATAEGVLVISCGEHWAHGLAIRYHGLERDPLADPEDNRSYRQVADFGYIQAGNSKPPPKTILFVPMNARCVAGPTGPDDYAFYRIGGWSWCAPYIGGFYALATGHPTDITDLEPGTQGVIVDPVSLIEALEAGD